MAKKAVSHMTHTERVAGTIFFVIYLLVLPLLADKLFALAEILLDTTIGESLRNVLFYYTLFAVTVLAHQLPFSGQSQPLALYALYRASRVLRRERAALPRVQRPF